MTKLTGQRLATEYARRHPLSEKNPGKVSGCYVGGGWIEISGSGLEPHPDMAFFYPNGWSLYSRLRSGEARAELDSNFRKLREKYEAAGCTI